MENVTGMQTKLFISGNCKLQKNQENVATLYSTYFVGIYDVCALSETNQFSIIISFYVQHK